MKRICKKAAYPLHCFIETTEKHSFYVEKHLKKRTSNLFKCYFYTINKKTSKTKKNTSYGKHEKITFGYERSSHLI